MFNQFDPTVKATIVFLELLKVKVTNNTVSETLQNHPDWPGLLCISDSLNKWNVSNGAGRINNIEIDQLPTPFIAFTSNRQSPLYIIKEVSETQISHYSGNYNNLVKESRNEFLKRWDGVYLIAESAEHSGEKLYEQNKKEFFLRSLMPWTLALILVGFSFLLLQGVINASGINQGNTLAGIYFQYFIHLAGILITSLLLWYEIDKSNPILQKVCTGIAKGNCNAILTGKQSKVFRWLSWSEVGFFYFTGGGLVLLFMGSENIANTIALLGWLNILALPYTVFSIYYQWRVARQWCVLCLAVQVLLVLGAVNILANQLLVLSPEWTIGFSTKVFLLFILPVLLWYSIKPTLLQLQQAKNIKREYLRLKFNKDIFEALLKKQKRIIDSGEGIGLNLGNSSATNTLIKVCNPYCAPCARSHAKIDELLAQNNNLKVKIIFTATNQEDDIRSLPAKHLLAIAERKNQDITRRALDDWYLSEVRNYDKFREKYPMNGELNDQALRIEAMSKWCKEMNISFTPTIFVNGYQLPTAYGIEDLEYFLAE